MEANCIFVNKETGKQCRAYPMKDSQYCFLHNPEISEEKKKLARIQGGKKKWLSSGMLPEKELKTARQVSEMLEEIINLVRTGGISDRKALLLKGLSDALLKSIELGEVEQKIGELEEYTKASP